MAHGRAWREMRSLLRSAGHELVTPTYTGLGERAHLAAVEIDLETHIRDILSVLEYEDLRDAVLLGHSYGGVVATGVAHRAQSRISQLIYLDAFVPDYGQSIFDIVGRGTETMMRRTAVAGPPVRCLRTRHQTTFNGLRCDAYHSQLVRSNKSYPAPLSLCPRAGTFTVCNPAQMTCSGRSRTVRKQRIGSTRSWTPATTHM